ncbi:MAG: hypothetical protein Phyf2KO_16260 [Phycisphaerales bacterium]
MLLLAGSLAGCTGLEPAAIGAGITAAQTGAVYVFGVDAYSYQPALYQDVFLSAIYAGDRLALDMYSERKISDARHELRYNFGDLKQDRLIVTITRATDAVTKVELNVKEQADSGMSTLYIRMMSAHLIENNAYDSMLNEEMIPIP